MSARITPLRLEAFDQLPSTPAAASSGKWIPRPSAKTTTSPIPNSRKKRGCRWSCWSGDRVVRWPRRLPTEGGQSEPACLGYAFYAPPRTVPRAHRFPTAPVSADAVLLTSMRVEPGPAADELPYSLVARVVDELVRRGVRALEAFGRTESVAELTRPADRRPRAAARARGAGGLLGRALRDRGRLPARCGIRCGGAASVLSRGCGSSWTRVWAGKPKSKRRWSGCWRARRCSSRSARERGGVVG